MNLDQDLAGVGLIVKQKNSECCRCACCQPNMEWTFHDYKEEFNAEEKLPTRFTALENASWCGRCNSCYAPGFRGTNYNVYQGEITPETAAQGKVILTHSKETSCGSTCYMGTCNDVPLRVPMCCCLPYLATKDPSGAILGTTKYVCDAYLCVPRFSIHGPGAEAPMQYLVAPDTCCLGCCVKCNCGGKGAKKCRVPFLVRDPTTMAPIGDAKITDLWAGLKKECCTKQNMYSIKYPEQASTALRATMMGAALLVDLIVYEQGDN